MLEDEWTKVVKSAKKRSASLIFSSRNYSIYKSTLGSTKMTSILIIYYNIIIKACYFPSRWMSILNVMIEKGSRPTLGKLHII